MIALLLPIPVILGRVGCLQAGCCGGLSFGGRPWPSVPVEITHRVLAFVVLLILRCRHWLVGQHFHRYLAAYGLFRFGHELLRATTKPIFGISGYQLIASATVLAGAIAFRHRQKPRVADSR